MSIKELYSHFLQSTGVSTDTRKLEKGQIYFALKGEQFDGNQYAQNALTNGAALAIIDDEQYHLPEKTVLVKDGLETLQLLAHYHRKQFSIPVIGITGSNGKTTTKELINLVLSQKYQVLATEGNLNNHIGVPLTLLNLRPDHEVAIIEMGANHVKEIDFLCKIAEPNFGVITSIGRAHIGQFGSYDAIKSTKSELYLWLARHGGKAFLNADIDVLVGMASMTLVEDKITYGTMSESQYVFQYVDANPFVRFSMDDIEVKTQLIGEYNFHNIITAATIGKYFQVPNEEILSVLTTYQPDNNRSQIIQDGSRTIILDAYNANPSSLEHALQNLESMQAAKKGAVLGEMLELGEYSLEEHQKITDLAESIGLDFLIIVGHEFSKVNTTGGTIKFDDVEAVKVWWEQMNLEGFLVLIKGSRAVKLESIVE